MLAKQRFILDLGKLLIAVAWADGKLDHREINVLKDLLFRIPDLTGEEYATLEVYMEHPVQPAERDALLERVVAGAAAAADRRLVIDTLTRLVEADGEVSTPEREFLDRAQAAIEGRGGGGLLDALRGWFGGPAQRASARAGSGSGGRDDRVDDFLRNTVYFQLVAEQEKRGVSLSLPEDRIRTLCLAAGLMGKVAWIDAGPSDDERAAMRAEVARHWSLSEDEAGLVVEMSLTRVARGLDHFRVCRGFFEATDPTERRQFLECLFRIANACGRTSQKEIVEIRRIADSIKVPHTDFIAAKLTIPAADRANL